MANLRTLQRSFGGGEISPEMFGRIDDAKYQSGLALCRNFVVKPQGPVENRAGFGFVREVKDSTKKARLIPFTFSTTQTMALELGAGYLRFHTQGATLLYTDGDTYDGAARDVTINIPPSPATVTISIGAPATVAWTSHGMAAGTPVKFSTTGALPTPLVAGQTYYIWSPPNANDFTIEAFPGNGRIITSGTQSGVHTCTPQTAVMLTANGFAAGTPVEMTTTGALPTGLAALTTYYVVAPQTNEFQLATTLGGTPIVCSGTQSGVHTLRHSYIEGAIARSSGVNYYCRARAGANAPPNTTYWYVLPSAPNIYEIPTGYAEADLFDIHYVQSADVLTLVHPNSAPRELRRLGATAWTLTTINFSAPIASPGSATASPTGTGTLPYSYVVTAIAVDEVSESAASVAATCSNNIYTTNNYNTISWAAVTGASRYSVYKRQGGLYGYIGQTTGLSIVDDNIAPDMAKTPPTYDAVFGDAGDYPAAVSYFEQRRALAGTVNKPQNIWMTKSGTESNMSYSLPIRDDDRIAFRVAAREANTIRHIVPLTQLLLLTSSAEWRVTSVNSDAITPSTISVRPQSYVGASNVQPSIINNTLLYGAARGGHVRELAYNWQANGFLTGDLSLRAAHLFDSYDVTDMCYAKAPMPLVWFISSSGKLLGLTYVPEQQIGAWHQHDTDGVFESCTAVAEGSEDVLYCIVRRTINGSSRRFIERQRSRQFVSQNEAFFVDCGLTYSGVATTVISGINHLEGKTVSILADGAVHPQRVVRGGTITLDNAASLVHVGLPIVADMQTLPVAAQVDNSYGQGRFKNVNKVWLRVFRSSGIFAGPSASALVEAKQRTTEDYGTPPALKSDEIELVLTPAWGASGQVFVRQSDPLPLTLVSLTAEVALGG